MPIIKESKMTLSLKNKKWFYFIFLVMLLPCFYGCASLLGYNKATPTVAVFSSYTPKAENENIDVYITNTPTQEYIEIAQIICKDHDDAWNLQQILIEARKIGADGIIVIGSSTNYWENRKRDSDSGSVTVRSSQYGVTAVAIKYK